MRRAAVGFEFDMDDFLHSGSTTRLRRCNAKPF